MAEAKEEFSKAADLEDELSCPVCLCLYRNPVSLTCGHSFCKECIQKALNAQQQSKTTYFCPMCKVELGPFLELHKNFQLCSIVETFKATVSKGKQGKEKGTQKKMVPCDFCLEQSQTAVKICLTCEASLCQAHLTKHNTKILQRDHVLVEVTVGCSLEDRKCREHSKLLECYCEDDETYICVLCSIAGSHKGHSVITMKEAYDQELAVLSETVKSIRENRSALNKALEELQKSENQLKINTKTLTTQLSNLFKEIKTEVEQKEKQILCDIQSNEKKQQADLLKVKKQMEEQRDKATQSLQELQMMRGQTDSFLFLREFKSVKDRIENQDFSIDSIDVLATQLSQITIAHIRSKTQTYISSLDSMMQEVHSEIINQMQQTRATQSTSLSFADPFLYHPFQWK